MPGALPKRAADATKSLAALAAARDDLGERQRTVEEMLEGTEADGIQLTTVLDDDYPVNLRTIYNLPPFLFYRGTLRPDDALSVAVVGTRQASADGLSRAERMARLLVDAGVTVLSGLARGIDTTAHQACLDAGGRTIAVLGSGIRRVYPPENEDAGRADRGERRRRLAVLARRPSDVVHVPAAQRGDLRDEPGHRGHRGLGDVGSEDAGAPRDRARQAGLPPAQPRNRARVGPQLPGAAARARGAATSPTSYGCCARRPSNATARWSESRLPLTLF